MLSEFLAIFISAALLFVDPKFPKIFFQESVHFLCKYRFKP